MSHINYNKIDPAVEARVDELMAQMTLGEKVAQMNQIFIGREFKRTNDVVQLIKDGVGSILTMYGAEQIIEAQRIAVEESRLGIPLLFGNDVIHGYRTIFPIPLAESCSWDIPLIEAGARIAAEEAAADGTNWIFAPMVDTCREPRWGRIAEGAGEDPFYGAAVARARVRGFQADDLESGKRIVACPKHYAAYGFSEAGKDYNSVDISEQTLRDMVLPPFQAAFDEGAGTIMSSFNDLNGTPASGNKWLMRDILRDEMGFNGIVLSDWNAIGELVAHGYAADNKHAGLRAIHAGIDMDMSTGAYLMYLEEQVSSGKVAESLIDEAVRRILRIKFMLGLFENPYSEPQDESAIFLKPEYMDAALDMTEKSMILLKNDELLPLSNEAKNIALIGPLADDHHEILGTWYRIGKDEDTESVLDGFNAVLPDANITHVAGCHLHDGNAPDEIDTAVQAAQAADIAVLVLGEAEWMSGEAHSRSDMTLPGKQQALLEAVHGTGTPIVLVLMGGRPLTIPWAAENIPAILMAWHGGLRTGTAVANLLTGKTVPSGKLVVSWPRNEGQIPVYYNHKNTGRPDTSAGTVQFGQVHTSRYLDIANTPLYPFGYGLSYTIFAYSDLAIENQAVGMNDTLNVTVNVHNIGQRDGAEVAQLYVRDRVGEVTRPVRELKGFERVELTAGESRTLTFAIPVQSLGFTNSRGEYMVEAGEFDLWVGGDSTADLHAEFTVIE